MEQSPPESYSQADEGQKCNRKQPEWIYKGQIGPAQPHSLSWWPIQ